MAASEVPQGTVQDVLDWVGDDPDRARQALDAEDQGQQRTTLTSKLEQIADNETDEDAVTSPTAPDNPNQPDNPDQTNQPTGTDTPGTPGSIRESGQAGTSGNPASPDAPGSGTTGNPDAPSTSNTTTGSESGEGQRQAGAPGPPAGIDDPARDRDHTAGGASSGVGGLNEGTDPDQEEIDNELPGPEQPADVVLDVNDTGTLISSVHARDYDVEVPEDDDMIPLIEPKEEEDEDLIEAEQVEYFQIAGGTNGVVISVNGTNFALLPQMAAALKTNLDKAVAGLAL